MRALLALLLLPACFPTSGGDMTEVEIEPALATPLDILIVLDDTPPMAAHLPRVPPPDNVAGVLVGIYNGAPDLRIAVTTSTTGTLRTSAAVPSGILEHTVRMTDGRLAQNYQGDLATALGSLMNVGTDSQGPNAPLASAAQAITAPDFVREGSGIGILLASASDDASPNSPASYAQAIQDAHGNAMQVSAIYPEPSQRLAAFVDGFGHRRVTPIDAYDMEAVTIFAQLFAGVSNDACFPVAPTDSDQCELFTTHDQEVNPLPACFGSAWASILPCYEMIADASCASGTAMLLGGGFSYYHPRIFGRCPT